MNQHWWIMAWCRIDEVILLVDHNVATFMMWCYCRQKCVFRWTNGAVVNKVKGRSPQINKWPRDLFQWYSKDRRLITVLIFNTINVAVVIAIIINIIIIIIIIAIHYFILALVPTAILRGALGVSYQNDDFRALGPTPSSPYGSLLTRFFRVTIASCGMECLNFRQPFIMWSPIFSGRSYQLTGSLVVTSHI